MRVCSKSTRQQRSVAARPFNSKARGTWESSTPPRMFSISQLALITTNWPLILSLPCLDARLRTEICTSLSLATVWAHPLTLRMIMACLPRPPLPNQTAWPSFSQTTSPCPSWVAQSPTLCSRLPHSSQSSQFLHSDEYNKQWCTLCLRKYLYNIFYHLIQ